MITFFTILSHTLHLFTIRYGRRHDSYESRLVDKTLMVPRGEICRVELSCGGAMASSLLSRELLDADQVSQPAGECDSFLHGGVN